MYRPKLTITDMWEAALVVLVIGAGAFLLSGLSGPRIDMAHERATEQACLTPAPGDPTCASPFSSQFLKEGRAAGRGPVEGLDVKATR